MSDTKFGEIFEMLIRAYKHVENLGGQFFARVIIHSNKVVSVNVDYEHIPDKRSYPNRQSGGFGVSVPRTELERLRRELEWMLDHFFGPEWRESEWTEKNTDEIIEILLRAQRYVESQVGVMKAVITICRQTVDIQVEVTMKRKRRLKTQRFGVSKWISKFGDLPEDLEMMLDIHIGQGWRREE